MINFGILMIIFGSLVLLAGLYLVYNSKGDFASVLLWKSNTKNMTKKEISYAGKVTMVTSLSLIISGIISLFCQEESFIPIIILLISFIVFLITAIKIFK